MTYQIDDPDGLPGHPLPTTGLFALGGCPGCGADELRAVYDGSDTNLWCPNCGACWHYSLGWFQRVDPFACPGCSSGQREACRARVGGTPIAMTGTGGRQAG